MLITSLSTKKGGHISSRFSNDSGAASELLENLEEMWVTYTNDFRMFAIKSKGYI